MPSPNPFDQERAAFALLAALVVYVMLSGWLLMAGCFTGWTPNCKPGEYGVRAIIGDTIIPVLIMFLFNSRKPPPS